jgi:NTE family protein
MPNGQSTPSQKLGLALGSGAWMGLAHIGVIKSLCQHDIPISFISGSSIGAIIGGLYAATNDIYEIEKIAKSLSFKSVVKPIFQKSSDRRFSMNNKFDQFFKNIIGDVQIEDLKIPYSAVASNLLTGESLTFTKGSLITAMKASSAVPLVFNPVKIGSDYFFDGGMTHPIPVDVVKQMGADIVMGVNLYNGIFPVELSSHQKMSRLKAFKISRYIWLQKLAQFDLKSADISLNLNIPNDDYGIFAKFFNNQKVIDYGQSTTDNIISKIKISG